MVQQGNNANLASMMGMPRQQLDVGATDPKNGNIVDPNGLSAFWNNSYAPNPATVIGDMYKVWQPDQSGYKTADAANQSVNDQLGLMGKATEGMNQYLPQFGQQFTQFNAANDQGAQDALLGRVAGGADAYNQIDRNANPELWNAANKIGNQQAPTHAKTNWMDGQAYGMLQQDVPQLQTDPGTQDLTYKNWATDVMNDQVWLGKGVNMATADKNQIFNYSPEANRAREITGARLSDGGGENMAYAYGAAQDLRKTGTSAAEETAARDKLLSDMSRASSINVGQVGLDIDREGKISDRELRDATQDARAAFNDRGRVRGTGAAIAEIMANEDARRARRTENNTNNLNQANVGLANAQNQLQASVEQGRQNLSRMGQANQVLGDRFDQRMAEGDSYNRRMMESIGALAGTDAQRFSNFQAGVDANMGIDADFQNRVDRYSDMEMKQNQFNTDQTNNWLNQLAGIDDRYQNINRENNALAAQRAQFGNNAAMGQNDMDRARIGDLQGASADWRNREQQDFANQLGMNQQEYNAYMGLRSDPYGALSGIQGTRLDPNQQAALNYGIGQRDYMGFSDYMNLGTGLINAEMGYDAQKRADDSSRKAAWTGAIGTVGGSILGGLFG